MVKLGFDYGRLCGVLAASTVLILNPEHSSNGFLHAIPDQLLS